MRSAVLRCGWSTRGAAALVGVRPILLAAVGCLLLAGCTYEGGIDQPLTLRFNWYSYLNGDDIRARCRPGSLFEARLVYNGNYQEQIRSYEVTADLDGAGTLVSRVLVGRGGLDLSRLSLSDPLKQWEWTKSEEDLSPAEGEAFVQSLRKSGAFEPAPEGLRLYSNAFYWVVSGCQDGQFFFNAWQYPSERYASLTFPEFLEQHDATGISFNPPRKRDVAQNFASQSGRVADGASTRIFQLQVEKNGLVGI